MNRSFIVAVLTVTMIVMMSTAGYAFVSPHLFACDHCHAKHTGTTALAATNGCTACHSTLGQASRMPIDADAMSNIFGTTPGQPAKGSKSTHNYLATAPYAPGAMATDSVNPTLNDGYDTINLTGNVYCIRCHNAKSNANTGSTKPFLRIANDNDSLCLECHNSRNVGSSTSGTHPVFSRSYSAAYKSNTSAFRKVPLNANSNNRTSNLSTYLKGNKIACSTCHAPHYADSNSATLDNRSTANGFAQDDPAKGLKGRLQESNGQLLRTDAIGATADSINVCSSCHKETKNMNHNAKGQNIQCDHCHGAHVDFVGTVPAGEMAVNRYLVRRDFSNMSTAKVKLGANVKAIYNTATSLRFMRADGRGICQVCHTPTPGVAIHDLTDTRKEDCIVCHKHSNGFTALDCNACHGQPPVTSYVGGPNGSASQGYTLDESYTPHATHASAGYYNYACKNCHYDGTRADSHNTQPTTGTATFASVFIETAGSVGDQLGLKNVPTDYNSTAKTCANVYCHSNGNPRSGSIQWKSATTPSWNFGRNTILGKTDECINCHESGATLMTNAHYKHVTTNSIKCYVCHAATVNASMGIIDRTKHADGTKNVSFVTRPENYGLFVASYNSTDATCTNTCHTNGLGINPVTPAKWTDPATGACGTCHAAVATTTLHPYHFTGTTGPKLGANPDCASCHDYSAGASTHANGAVNLKAGNSCAPCHPATAVLPVWSVSAKVTCESCHTGTASVVLSQSVTYTAPLKGTNGHNQYSSATLNKVKCTACHDATANHIGATVEKRLLVAGNALCNNCHIPAIMQGMSTARANMLTHSVSINGNVNVFTNYTTTNDYRARDCAGCHDTHGTTNYMSVRAVVAGETIRPVTLATLSTALRVTSPNGNGIYNGLCQVCHTKVKYFKRNATPDLSHNGGKNCLNCHSHKMMPYAFSPNGDCSTCHGYPPVQNMTGLGTIGNYIDAKLQDYSGGGGAHSVAGHIPMTIAKDAGSSACLNCHNNFNNGSHNQGSTPVKKSFVNVVVDPQYKFNNMTAITYSGNTCSNVSCHFKPSPNWVTGN